MKKSIKFTEYSDRAGQRGGLGRSRSRDEANRSFIFTASVVNCRVIRELKGKERFRPIKGEIVYFGTEYLEILHRVLCVDYAQTEDPIRSTAVLHPSNLAWICNEVRYFHNEPKTTQGKITRKAAFLLYQLTSKHPFVDGNKRTALIATNAFLEWNNYSISL